MHREMFTYAKAATYSGAPALMPFFEEIGHR
jgi:hypothetical protein